MVPVEVEGGKEGEIGKKGVRRWEKGGTDKEKVEDEAEEEEDEAAAMLPRIRGRTHSHPRGDRLGWLCPSTRRGRWWVYFLLCVAVGTVLMIHLLQEFFEFYFAVDINHAPQSRLGSMYTVR